MISRSHPTATALRGNLRRCLGPKVLVQFLFPILCLHPLMSEEAKVSMPTTGQRKALEYPVKFTGVLYKSGSRRDPFLNPLSLNKNQKKEDEELSRGLPPPGIAGTYIAQAVLQGTSIRENGRVAVVRGADSRAYFLKEGDRLFDGYLKTIENDSITLVRETKMKSGKTLTQDVTKRLRTP